MIEPKDWTRFSSGEEKLQFLKKLFLVPRTQNYVKQFYYTGVYAEKPSLCSVEGYSDSGALVISLGGSFHCINAEYLKDMQTGFYRLPEEYIVLDLETTGLSPQKDRIVEFAAVKYVMGREKESLVSLINPGCGIPIEAEKINNISNQMVADAPSIEEFLPSIREFLGETPIAAHNAPFDMGFLKAAFKEGGESLSNFVIDTLALCKKAFPDLQSHSLSSMKKHLNIQVPTAHRALPDVYATAELLEECAKALSPQ